MSPEIVIRSQEVCVLASHTLVLTQLEQLLSENGFATKTQKLDPVLYPTSPPWVIPRAAVYVVSCESDRNLAIVVGHVASDSPNGRLVVVGDEFREETAFPLLGMGVKGLVTHSRLQKDLARAIETVAAGGYWVPRTVLARFVDRVLKKSSAHRHTSTAGLSRRQKDVMDGLLANLSNKEIANKLNISERTVKFHVSALLEKFGVRRRADLILLCYQEDSHLAIAGAMSPGSVTKTVN